MDLKPIAQNAQKQSLTTALRNICCDYPPGGGVLRELLQNADDAGATEVRFVLDRRTHPVTNLIDDKLSQYQGPALLAYNNAEFTDKDLASIARLGDSLKLNDGTTTGKFGRGFNSVYNWTDSPSIVSREKLYILDPHFEWSDGGPIYDFVADSRNIAIQGQMKAFEILMDHTDQHFNGTIIRIPLRNNARAPLSDIKKGQVTTSSEISEVLHNFAGEFADNGLLFMRNITKLEITTEKSTFKIEFLDPDMVKKHKAAINQAVVRALKDSTALFDYSFEATLRYSFLGGFKDSGFAIHHRISAHAKNNDLQKWSVAQQLLPWVAIAAKLPTSEPMQGSLFSVLPLPIGTTQPVYIHGLFSISPDRARLYYRNDKSNQDQHSPMWNELLMTSVIPEAWIKLLTFIAEKYPLKDAFERWPKATTDQNDPLSTALSRLLDFIKTRSLPLWPTSIGYRTVATGLLAMGTESVALKDALSEARIPIVYVPSHLSQVIKPLFQGRLLMSGNLASHLRLDRKMTALLSDKSKLQILEHLLLDTNFINFEGLALFPFKDETFGIASSRKAFVLRDKSEKELFAANKARNIDFAKLSTGAQNSLRRGCDVARFGPHIQYYSSTSMAEYATTQVFNNIPKTQDSAPLGAKQVKFVCECWKWMINHNIDILDTAVFQLWLLPASGGTYRKVRPANLNLQIYVAPSDGDVGVLMTKLDAKLSVKEFPLLETKQSGIPNLFVTSLRGVSSTGPQWAIRDAGKLQTFLAWLQQICARNENIIDDDDRVQLAKIIALKISLALTSSEKTMIKNLIKDLTIFQKASWIEQDEKLTHTLTWTSISSCTKTIGLLDHASCPTPTIQNSQFLAAPFDTSTKKILEVLQTGPCLTTAQVVQDHIIPAWSTEGAAWSHHRKTQLAHLVLQNYHGLSQKARTHLRDIPLIPAMCLDGTDSMRFAKASELIDPTRTELRDLCFDKEEILPHSNLFPVFQSALFECGLKREVDWALIEDRINSYASSSYSPLVISKRAENLLITKCRTECPPGSLDIIRTLSWLPVIDFKKRLVLVAAADCRSQRQHLLVSFKLPLLKSKLASDWERWLGWEEGVLSSDIILAQLSHGINTKNRKIVDAIFAYIQNENIFDRLSKDLASLSCIITSDGYYSVPALAFCPEKNVHASHALYPYAATVDAKFWDDHKIVLQQLGIVPLGLTHLLAIQAILEIKGVLSAADISVAIEIMNLLSKYGDSSRHLIKVISDSGLLFPIDQINYLDHGTLKPKDNVTLAHPHIPLPVITRLKIVGLQEQLRKGLLEIDDRDDEEEYEQQESVTTRILDNLGRYPIETTFKEFLANADDSMGASKVSWLLDTTEYPRAGLVSNDLELFQGPALNVHNDAVFSEKDFEGFKNVGEGSKGSNKTTIGQFGRGSQTMYHWTDVPFLLSGEWLIILDPQRQFLHRSRTGRRFAGVRIRISVLKEAFAGQLAPFVGLWGYTPDLDYYPGTIFRFPLRKAAHKSVMGAQLKIITVEETENMLQNYFDEARISLLFLRRISSLAFETSKTSGWSVTRTPHEDDKSFSGAVTCEFEISDKKETQIIGKEKWWVAIEDVKPNPKYLPDTSRRVLKNTECGFAALTSSEIKYVNESHSNGLPKFPDAARSRIFVTLPLPLPFSSDLPVHLHATFALSGDRRSIAIDSDSANSYGAKWNRYLFENALPNLYLEFLDELVRQTGQDAFNFWPHNKPPTKGSCAEALTNAFWKLFPDCDQRLFPRAADLSKEVSQRRSQKGFRISQAVFDTLPRETSDAVSPFLIALGVNLVRFVPTLVKNKLKNVPNVTFVSGEFLRKLFKSEEASRLEQELHQYPGTFAKLLHLMVPEPAQYDDMDGCHCLLLMDGNLATLKLLDPVPSGTLATTYLVATRSDAKPFMFAASLLVDSNDVYALRAVIATEKFNVSTLQPRDIKSLLRLRGSNEVAQTTEGLQWLKDFWTFCHKAPQAVLSDLDGIEVKVFQAEVWRSNVGNDRTRSLHYAAPKDFPTLPAIVSPKAKEHQSLCELFPGLYLFDRRFLPKQFVKQEDSLDEARSFCRFVHALRILGDHGLGLEAFVRNHLTTSDLMKQLQALATKYVLQTSSQVSNPPMPYNISGDLQNLPIWQTWFGENFVTAKEALIVENNSFLVPWMKNSARLVVLTRLGPSEQACLKSLNSQKLSNETLLSSYVFPLPSLSSQLNWDRYKTLIASISRVTLPPSLKQYLEKAVIAVDGNRGLQLACELFDDNSPMFMAAFRNNTNPKFLHPDLKQYRHFFNTIGLRSYTAGLHFTQSADYLQCLQAIENRLKSQHTALDVSLTSDCQLVLAPLTVDTSPLRGFTALEWTKFADAKVFRTKTNVSGESQYRQSKMSSIASNHQVMCLSEIISYSYAAMCWSQTPFAASEPTFEALGHINGARKKERPTLPMVWNHLMHMQSIAATIKRPGLFHFLQDLKLTYQYFQDHVDQCQHSFKLVVPASQPLWLNLGSFDHNLVTLTDAQSEWYSIGDLVLSSACDAGPIKAVKTGLMDFEKLLKVLGCNSIIYPTISRAETKKSGYSLLASMRQKRKDESMTDITYISEGKKIHAHRNILAAASDFCNAKFSGPWTVENPVVFDKATDGDDFMTYHTLSCLVAFAYEEDIDWRLMQVAESDSVEKRAEKLDLLLDLCKGADFWLMEELKDMAEGKILDAGKLLINLDNVLDIKERAGVSGAGNLEKMCEGFEKANQKVVSKAHTAK